MMTSEAWISLVACAGLLGLCLSTWNFAAFALARSGEEGWRLMAVTAALMSVPSALHLVLSFVGERRRLAAVMFTAYGLFGVLAATSLLGLGSARELILTAAALALPLLGVVCWLLARHLGWGRSWARTCHAWATWAPCWGCR
jgi:two-component system sensor histidine kinase HydH